MGAPRRAVFAEEAAEVEVLQASLEKMKSLTKKIQGSMSRLEVSGRTVEDAIGPVYGSTQRLQTTNANVDRILLAIEKAKEPLEMRSREDRILRGGPDRVGLAEYISSVDRANQALRELKSSKMRANQKAIDELNGLLQVGVQNLQKVFRDVCSRDCQPIEPLGVIMKASEFPRMNSNTATQLRTISTQIHTYTSQVSPGELSPSTKVYAQERGQYITLSLQNLAAASLSTARKVAGADAVYKQGSNGIGTYATALQGMYTAEYDNICPIFSREEWGAVFSATCEPSLAVFASTLRDLDTHIKGNLITDCFLAYEIVDVVSNTSLQLENRTGELKQAMSEALKPIRETAKSSLSMLLADIRNKVHQMQALPYDGAMVPFTSEVMQRLQRMSAYLLPLSSVMRSLGDGGWAAPNTASSGTSIPTLKSFDVGADGKQLFGHYCADTIEALLSSLEAKSRSTLKSKSLQGFFLSNNVVIVERMIRSSELGPLLSNVQPKLDGWKKKSTNLLMEPWRDLGHQLLDAVHTSKQSRPPSTGANVDSAALLKSMSSADKNAIKEKFRNFNIAFDELVAKHKTYRMEPEVRRLAGKEIHSFMEPLYNRWWERYHEVDKGKGKHVKYDKAQFSAVLASLA